MLNRLLVTFRKITDMMRTALILLLTILITDLRAQTERVTLTSLNSEYIEYAPSISADGTKMVFQSNRNGDYQLYESIKNEEGKWSEPTLLQGKINDYGDSTDLIGGPSLSYDGNFIFFFASYNGGLGVEDIYYSEREGDLWGTPQNIGAPISSKQYEGFPSISSDGNSLYFMRLNKNLEKQSSCYTLMVSHKDADGNWQEPYALPEKINQGCEKFPKIMPDNETFIFSSIRENTLEGSFDLFQVRHLGNNEWTEPLWLNYANTASHDYFASVSSVAENIYLNTKGAGNYDLYSYYIPEHLRPKKVINVKGVVTNLKATPLSANLKVYNQEKNKLIANLPSNHTDGSFTLVLPEGTYQLEVVSAGYYPKEEELVISMPKIYGPVHKDIQLTPYTGKGIVRATNVRTQEKLTPDKISVLNLADSSEIVTEGNSFDVKYNKRYQITISKEGFADQLATLGVNDVSIDTHWIDVNMVPEKPKVIFQPKDKDSKRTIPISLMIKQIGSKKVLFRGKTPGDTTLTLDFGKKYSVYALSKNYLFLKETLDLSDVNSYQKIDHEVLLQFIQPGAKLTLDEVLFPSNSSELEKSSYDELAAVYKFLKYNRTLVVEIAAHTDHVGSLSDNLALSNARAQSVVDFLVSKGADSTRLVAKGYGEVEPISSNHHAEGRAQNRRVEFRVLKVK
ncbi:MAG: OmpA family protein [Reichenbachiella sp.]|uniref:OmpA family protein n=3 Tax=Reichenbachiella sp. TaxID=2184521 RepID=UPI0032635ACF